MELLQLAAVVLPLGLLVFVAYRGYSVILFAPLCALLGVLLTGGFAHGLPFHSNIFMATTADFVQKYFAVFLLGAVFGKVIELSGSAASISKAIINFLGPKRAILAIVLACAVLTYGGVSLFVVAFAAYPFAASLFREAKLPKRLIPGAIALGSFTFTMDALPGTPQIQNIIPTTFFGTTIYAAPILGAFGAVVVFGCGWAYLERRARQALAAGEGYGAGHVNEPEEGRPDAKLPNPWLAILPLALVGGVELRSHAAPSSLVRRVVRLRGHRAAVLSRGEGGQRRRYLVDRNRAARGNRRHVRHRVLADDPRRQERPDARDPRALCWPR